MTLHTHAGKRFAGTVFFLSLGTLAQAAANLPPTATAATVTTKEDTKASITLTGTDPEKKKLTYAIVTQPTHGTVTLAGSKATYLPAANYFNTTITPDSFTFKTNDGTQDSAPATIKVVVTAVNDPPVAQSSTASAVQDTALDISLVGTDLEGDALTYIPAKTSKKGGTVALKSGNTVTYTPKKGYIGADSFTFTVQDSNKAMSKTATVTLTVTAKPANQSPIANVGADQTVAEQTTVTLDGSGSKDPDGTIKAYAWKQTAGTKVSLSSTSVSKPTFTAPDVSKNETLTFELTVTDDKGATAKDSVTLTVTAKPANQSPIANAGADQTVDEQTTVTLDGSGSKDPDGTIKAYAWNQTAGTKVSLSSTSVSKPTFTAPDVSKDETLTFELTVTDDKGATAKDSANILVKAVNGVIVQPTPTGKLNDTGITTCAPGAYNGTNCPQSGYPGQDAESGRDANQATNNDNDGHRGFSFTKISSTGQALPSAAIQWACVKDNVTGLIWEVKTDDGNAQTYSWYEPDNTKNGGNAGTQNGGNCKNNGACDTYSYVKTVNTEGLCGAKDWRMPTIDELLSLVNFDGSFVNGYGPTIDVNYFPNTRITFSPLSSSSTLAAEPDNIASITFGEREGYETRVSKNEGVPVWLVRDGQK